jgi:hypothetical protein
MLLLLAGFCFVLGHVCCLGGCVKRYRAQACSHRCLCLMLSHQQDAAQRAELDVLTEVWSSAWSQLVLAEHGLKGCSYTSRLCSSCRARPREAGSKLRDLLRFVYLDAVVAI